MSDHIKPPVLMSRVLGFVFATALVVLGVLGYTVYDMFPLNRPQIFFLTTQPRDNLEITLTEMVPTDENFELYKERFVREYIRARNEIFPNAKVMIRKWANDEDGIVRTWSTSDVYNEFTRTDLWRELMTRTSEFDSRCQVEFKSDEKDITTRPNNSYAVNFRYFCDGHTQAKDYTIIVTLEFGVPNEIRWTDRLNNPLGIRVAGYTIESGNGDPLDIDDLTTAQ